MASIGTTALRGQRSAHAGPRGEGGTTWCLHERSRDVGGAFWHDIRSRLQRAGELIPVNDVDVGNARGELQAQLAAGEPWGTRPPSRLR